MADLNPTGLKEPDGQSLSIRFVNVKLFDSTGRFSSLFSPRASERDAHCGTGFVT